MADWGNFCHQHTHPLATDGYAPRIYVKIRNKVFKRESHVYVRNHKQRRVAIPSITKNLLSEINLKIVLLSNSHSQLWQNFTLKTSCFKCKLRTINKSSV